MKQLLAPRVSGDPANVAAADRSSRVELVCSVSGYGIVVREPAGGVPNVRRLRLGLPAMEAVLAALAHHLTLSAARPDAAAANRPCVAAAWQPLLACSHRGLRYQEVRRPGAV
jgi:hypothetical protein